MLDLLTVGPKFTGPQFAYQPQLSIDICCPRPISAANLPAGAAALDRRDRQTDGHSTVSDAYYGADYANCVIVNDNKSNRMTYDMLLTKSISAWSLMLARSAPIPWHSARAVGWSSSCVDTKKHLSVPL